MAEPTQKRRKDWGVGAAELSQKSSVEKFLKFRTTHRSNPADVDLTEFEVGQEVPRIGGKRKWNGPFKGRRILIEELAPHIRISYGDSSRKSTGTLMNSLRIWWRLLDKHQDVAPVMSVADLGDYHGAIQFKEGISGDATNLFLHHANAARVERGCSPLVWAKNPRKPTNPLKVNVPTEDEVRALYQTLKRKVFATIDRWRAFDAFAWDGTDWSDCMDQRPQNMKWTLPDSFATFKGISVKTGHPCPSRSVCASRLNLKSPGSKFFGFYQQIIFGLYPSRTDVQDILIMLVLKSGWNGKVAVEIDAQDMDRTVRDHASSNAHNILYANKGRGNTRQKAFGKKDSDLSPANMVELLVGRTTPLRECLIKELASLNRQALSNDSTEQRRIELLRNYLASGWVYVKRDDSAISTLTPQNYSAGTDGKSSAMLDLIRDTNRDNIGVAVPESYTLSDFRDAFISFAHEFTGYSWLETQLAAGHTNVNSLVTYLRNRRWKMHGEGRVRDMLTFLWAEIRERRIVDPAVLRAMAERGEVTQEQRIRWMNYKDRTYVGMGCKDFKNPPKNIAPEHVEGCGCVVQRCTLCKLGVIFDDSVDHLARRFAELEWTKREIPLNTWYQSSFPLEVQATEFTFKNFSPEVVEERVKFWEIEIREGRHVPLGMEGEYGQTG